MAAIRGSRFDKVDFGKSGLKSVNVRAASAAGSSIEIHIDKVDGPLLAKVEIGKSSEWRSVQSKLKKAPGGVHDLVITQSGNNGVDLDWIRFE